MKLKVGDKVELTSTGGYESCEAGVVEIGGKGVVVEVFGHGVDVQLDLYPPNNLFFGLMEVRKVTK